MERFKVKALVVLAVLGFVAAMPAFADEGQVSALQSQVQDLNDKISNLERQLRDVEGKFAPHETGHHLEQPGEGGLLHVAEDINMGGHLDVQWNNNFRQPATANNTRGANPGATAGAAPRTNAGRIFDRSDGSFAVNASEIYFEKTAEEVGSTGFRTDIMFGEDAAVVNGDGDSNVVDLQQAYVEYNAPLGIFEGNTILPDNVKIKAGRYVTLAGAEVIEQPNNWNISRSFLFGYAIPFAHTGVRTNFGLFNDFFDTYFGFNNGWDNAIDNNSFKTLESGIGYEPLEGVNVFHSLYWGGEVNDTNAGKRWLLTNVVSYDVTDKLSVMGDFSYGDQNNVQDAAAGVPQAVDATWWGFAGYARYQLTDKLAVAYRAEWFRDETLFRTALADTLFGQTLTSEYKIDENLLARAELRFDKANDDNIIPGAGTTVSEKSSQTTIGASLVYII